MKSRGFGTSNTKTEETRYAILGKKPPAEASVQHGEQMAFEDQTRDVGNRKRVETKGRRSHRLFMTL